MFDFTTLWSFFLFITAYFDVSVTTAIQWGGKAKDVLRLWGRMVLHIEEFSCKLYFNKYSRFYDAFRNITNSIWCSNFCKKFNFKFFAQFPYP